MTTLRLLQLALCFLLLSGQVDVLNAFGLNTMAVVKTKLSNSNFPLRLSKSTLDVDDVSLQTAPLTFNDTNTFEYESSAEVAMDVALDHAEMLNTASPDGLECWKRRLITHEDPFSLHKLSAVGYTVSSAIMLGSAAVRYAISPDLFAVIPPETEAIMNIFTVSNIIMCTASVRMAFSHRQGDLTARNAFLGTAVSSLFSGFFMVWISP